MPTMQAFDKTFDEHALDPVLKGLDRYPVSNIKLVERARKAGVSGDVITFLESIPASTSYDSRDDVIRRYSLAQMLEDELQSSEDESPQAGYLGED